MRDRPMNPHAPPATDVAATRRLLKILYFVLFGTVGLYWVVLEALAPNIEPRDPGLVKPILQGLGVAMSAAVLYLRFGRIAPLLDPAALGSPARLAQLRLPYFLCFVLAESVALYGLVLRLLGGSREDTALFFLATAALFLLCYPRLPESVNTPA